MEKFGKSQPVTRVEDSRLLTGQGRYVDDIAPDGAYHAYFLRSPVAHAEVTALDLTEARSAPGVHLVWAAADLAAEGLTAGLAGTVVDNLDGTKGAAPRRPMLAEGRVRHVGEAVALVVADSLTAARDAAEMIEFDFEDLPAKVDVAPGGEVLHAEAPENLAFHWGLGEREATEDAFAAAAHHVTLEVPDTRIIVNSMEPRGCFAEWDGARLHFCVNGQGVWATKGDLTKALGLDAEQVRVTNPDVGGAFGMKAMNYPEYAPVALAAMRLGHPVRWMSDRSEAMLTDNAGRDLTSTCELAFDDEHRITAYRVTTVANMGAYNSGFAQPIQTMLFSRVLAGTYDIQCTWLEVRGIFTNTACVDAYRGAGRPEAIYALERVMDQAARELGVDPWDLRRRNFIRPDQFPYKAATGETYDVGDFRKVLAASEVQADRAGFAARRAASEARGRLRGMGLCYYIESILGDPAESARVEFTDDGLVNLYVGTQSGGQGHETVFAQFLSDQSGIPLEAIRVIQGDSDRIKQGGGTGGSRSGTVQAAATLETVSKMIEVMTPFVAEELGVSPDAVRFDEDKFRADGSNQSPTVLEVAELARAAGRDDLLIHEERITLPARSFPNGAHVAEVEIDPATGKMVLERYAVSDDFGNLLNPRIVEGQVHGGVAQGAGQVMMEHVVYDQDGQLLTGSFMDYAMPRAEDLPMIGFQNVPTPSTYNPMGMKGCGEAGTVGSMAALTNAVADALAPLGAERVEMPFTPERLWRMIGEARAAS